MTVRARQLRHAMTPAEQRLWAALRSRQLGGYKFRRQAPAGPFIIDFICLSCGLAIELDGGQHALSTEQDLLRTHWLSEQGVQVMRFWNTEIEENLEGVIQTIFHALVERDVERNQACLEPPSHPSP
ncbi:MAG: DUF559 domain-containing protein [Candidatus Delongbacteria bacterium]